MCIRDRVNSPLKTFQEPSSSTELLDSVEVCKSLPTTQAEPISPPNQTSHISKEVSPSGSTVIETPLCEYNPCIGSIDSGMGSLDSGVGSLDSSHSSSKLGEKLLQRCEGQNNLDSSQSSSKLGEKLHQRCEGQNNLDSSQSSSKVGEKLHQRCEGQNKRGRSESADISDYSDIECDGVAKEKIERTHTKKLKVSEFAKQVLHSRRLC